MKNAVFALAAAILAFGSAAHATSFTGDYRIDKLGTTDPGLIVSTHDLPGAVHFTLDAVGDKAKVNLFKLFTPETSIDADDLKAKPIWVGFDLTALGLGAVTGADVTGSTIGQKLLLGLVQGGAVNWGAGQVYDFGDGGQILVTLNNATFDQGAFAPKGGLDRAATVTATFTLISAAAVPEPATWALMIGGFGLAGMALRRRGGLVAA